MEVERGETAIDGKQFVKVLQDEGRFGWLFDPVRLREKIQIVIRKSHIRDSLGSRLSSWSLESFQGDYQDFDPSPMRDRKSTRYSALYQQ